VCVVFQHTRRGRDTHKQMNTWMAVFVLQLIKKTNKFVTEVLSMLSSPVCFLITFLIYIYLYIYIYTYMHIYIYIYFCFFFKKKTRKLLVQQHHRKAKRTFAFENPRLMLALLIN
jgi:hypothetical protein